MAEERWEGWGEPMIMMRMLTMMGEEWPDREDD